MTNNNVHVVSKEQCEICMDTGRDNKVVYSDGSTYCFGCKTLTRENGSNNMNTNKIKTTSLVETGRFQPLDDRGISQATCEFFNYQVGSFTGYLANEHVKEEPVHIANYCSEYGDIVAQKLRATKKRMTIRGNAHHMLLYGQWKYNPNDKIFITVVEGEIDCLSVAEVQGTGFPVVSIPNGAANAKKALRDNLEFLQGFKHVVLGFDNDEAGIAATKECIELFEPGKVRAAKWSLKDPNELLVAGRGKELRDSLWNAQEIRPERLCAPSDLLSRILIRPDVGLKWPWEELTKCTLGMREKQLIIIGAAPGIGKTEMIKDIVLHMASKEQQPCGIFSFEQDAADTMRRLIGGMLGLPIHLPDTPWDEKAIIEKANELEGKVYVYDNWGGAKVEDIAPKMRFLSKAFGIKLFVIDHLTALAAKMDGDERRGIEKAMELLASLTRELKCSIILASHLARDKKIGSSQSDSWGHGRRPSLENFKGSGAIEAWADVVLGLSRNADSSDIIEKQVLNVECLKARLNGAMRGHSFILKYNDNKGSLEEIGL